MGLTKIKEIVKAETKRNVNPELPVAIISNASQKNEKIFISKFGNIIQTAAEAEKPAVLVFGNCVDFHKKLYNSKNIENCHEKPSYSLDY